MFAKFNDIKARRAAGEKGFTLVELLVVVVIIAVLAAIAIPIFLNQKTKAQNSADQATVTALANAINIGMSTGGSAVLSSSLTGSLAVTDGTGATVTVPNGGAIVTVGSAAGNNAYSGALSGTSTFCVSKGGYTMTQGQTAPSVAAACTVA